MRPYDELQLVLVQVEAAIHAGLALVSELSSKDDGDD